jgi:hypothetical protein
MSTKTTLENGQRIQGQTDWAAVDALADEEIVAAALSDPDAQPLTEEQLLGFFDRSMIRQRKMLSRNGRAS